MTFFYEGDDKWLSWLEGMGFPDPPLSGNAAQWPKFMWGDVKRAKEEWKKPFHSVLDWENRARPLLDTWVRFHLIDRANDTKRYISRLLNKYKPKGPDDAKELREKIEIFLANLSGNVQSKEAKLAFQIELGGSIGQGTKIGPCDEWDYRMVLSHTLTKSDPSVRKLYTVLWQCLREMMEETSNVSSPLKLVGFIINNARLPSLVFDWNPASAQPPLDEEIEPQPSLIKVDLAPVVPGAPWEGKRKENPLTKTPLTKQNYLLLYGSDSREPTEQDPTWKPCSSSVEQSILISVPPLVRSATVLLKILTGPMSVPHFDKAIPKACRFTSYNIKDCLFWALSENKLGRYLQPDADLDTDDVNIIILLARDLLASAHSEEYFSFGSKTCQLHPFLQHMFHALLTGRDAIAVCRNAESASPVPGWSVDRPVYSPVTYTRDVNSAPPATNPVVAQTSPVQQFIPAPSEHQATMEASNAVARVEDMTNNVKPEGSVSPEIPSEHLVGLMTDMQQLRETVTSQRKQIQDMDGKMNQLLELLKNQQSTAPRKRRKLTDKGHSATVTADQDQEDTSNHQEPTEQVRTLKPKRISSLDINLSPEDKVAANDTGFVIALKASVLYKFQFVDGMYNEVWKRENALHDDQISDKVELLLLPDSRILLSFASKLDETVTITKLYTEECVQLSRREGSYGELAAASNKRMIYKKTVDNNTTLKVYSINDHQFIGELAPVHGMGWNNDAGACLNSSGDIVVRNSHKLLLYNLEREYQRRCEVRKSITVHCSDKYIALACGYKGIEIFTWSLKNVCSISSHRAGLELTNSDFVRKIFCGDKVLHLHVASGRKLDLVAYCGSTWVKVTL